MTTTYHRGRPIVRYGAPHKDYALILCPLGHVVHNVEIGSLYELACRAGEVEVTCDGALPRP